MSAATTDCSARRSDDRFELPNLLSHVPKACPRRIQCSHRTRIRVQPSIYIATARRSSLEWEG